MYNGSWLVVAQAHWGLSPHLLPHEICDKWPELWIINNLWVMTPRWLILVCHSCERSGCFWKISLKQVSASQFRSRTSKAIWFLNWLLLEQIREEIHWKKKFSFGHCPNSLTPPPWPQFGQLGPLFSDVKIQDLKVSLELKILYILYNILYICNLKNS